MPEYLAPGVYVEEVSFRPKSIEGVGTSTTAFVGPTRKGPLDGTPEVVTSFGEFERVYGGLENLSFNSVGDADPPATNYLAHAVRAFFDNGGSRLYVGRTFQPRTNLDGTIASDGVARSQPFVSGASGQARLVARMPGSGLNLTIRALEKLSPASLATMRAAPPGTLLRIGGGSPARPATLLGGTPPFRLNNNDQFVVNLRTGPQTITFQGANAEASGTALADPNVVPIPANATLRVTIGSGPQTIALPAGNSSLDDLADSINAALRHGYARVAGGNKLVLGSDLRGSAARVEVAANEPLGFAAATIGLGAGNVPNLDSVTVADVNQLLQAAGAPVQAILPPATGQLTLVTTEASPDARLRVDDTAARNALGFPTTEAQGAPGASVVYYRKVGDNWIGGADRATALNLGVPLPDTAQLTSLTLLVEEPDGTQLVYDDLGLDRAHPRWAGAVLAETPNRRADALLNPCYLDVGDNVGAFELRDGLLGPLGGNTITLTGGNDGGEPVGATVVAGAASYERALGLLELVEDISIVAAPGHSSYADTSFRDIQGLLIGHAERMKYRIAVLDTPPGQTIAEARETRSRIDSTYAALYHPWVTIANPLARPGNDRIPREIPVPPSGFVAGVYARTDIQRGVWKAPANEMVRGALRFETDINFRQQEVLNPEGVNCLRFFYGRGNRVWGARTASSDPEWKYVNVRRYFIYLERSIDRSTQWAVFEPNGESLWANITETVSAFLYNEWRSGALLGTKPEEAFFVRCGRDTMTQADLDNGRLICLVGVAALKPAEFVIFRIGQKTADARS